MVSFETIRYGVDDGVCTLTLHRPDKLNAVTPTMIEELIVAFDRIDADDAVRAVVVTGAGRAYCAGADLSGGGQTFAREGSNRSAAEHRDDLLASDDVAGEVDVAEGQPDQPRGVDHGSVVAHVGGAV